MEQRPWTCPFCDSNSTIGNYDISVFSGKNDIFSSDGYRILSGEFIICPNPQCKKFSLHVTLYKANKTEYGSLIDTNVKTNFWSLIPDSKAKAYSPNIIPTGILTDYEESCKILSLSPKASATLSRRALQGMIRNFWSIQKPEKHKGYWTLANEIDALKNRVEPDVWSAIDAVRKVGNIGAHMEQDVNILIEVDPNEAEKLIKLIELLFEEWYINRYKRQQRLASVIEIGETKTKQKRTIQKSGNLEKKL